MYPGVEHKVQLKGPIMGVATQRLCMWRNNFGSTAIALVSNFLSSVNENIDDDEQADNDSIDVDTDSDAQEKIMVHMARTLLKDYAFLFADPDTCQTSEIYRSIFMLQMIATVHLNTFIGFVDVPELNTSALPSMQMEGVIAACAVALERAFKLVADKEKKGTALKTPLRLNKATGKESSAQLAFSESNWGTFTRDYYLSLLRRGPNYTADTIIMAHPFVKDSSSDGSIKGSNVEGGVAAGGERAML
jgi:hypothetical protein